MRRTSVSLPTKQIAHDPFEKPARYSGQRSSGFFGGIKAAWMGQAQKARWFKTAALVFLVVFVFYYFSPRGVDIYHGGSG